MKMILETDIPQIKRLLWDVLQVSDYRQIERLGGLTNHTYKVELDDGRMYVVRLPGEGTEELINRSDEKISTQLACELGIDAQLLHFGPTGEKVTCYIDGAHTLSATSFADENVLRRVAKVFRILHTSGADTNVPFDVFEMAAGYERIIRDNHVELFEDYDEVKTQVMTIRNRVSSGVTKVVPCHNDPLCENWVQGRDGKLYLIDWEYAGMNDAMWDLADVSIEADLSAEQDNMLLGFYFNKGVTEEEVIRFHANKLYLDYLWSLWGKARVPFDGEPMEIYGQERYARLRRNLNDFLQNFPLE